MSIVKADCVKEDVFLQDGTRLVEVVKVRMVSAQPKTGMSKGHPAYVEVTVQDSAEENPLGELFKLEDVLKRFTLVEPDRSWTLERAKVEAA